MIAQKSIPLICPACGVYCMQAAGRMQSRCPGCGFTLSGEMLETLIEILRPGQQIIAAGNVHSMALKKDGTVWAWGDNDYGQLGINNRDDHQVPYQVRGPNNVDFLTDIGAPAASNPPGGENPPSDEKSDVTDVEPTSGATGVFRRTNVTATFSEPMDTSTLTKENFMLFEISAKRGPIQITNVSVTPKPEGTEVTLDPNETSGKALSKDTEYVAVVTTGVKDLDGNAMATPEIWRFETGRQIGG